jgi:large subunit ribosomal protein L17
MATSLVEYGAITTTVVKAKALKPIMDKLLTLAKKGDLSSIRRAGAILYKRDVLKTLFANAAKNQYDDRVSGYCSVVRVGIRAGDAAPMAKVVLLSTASRQADSKKPVRVARKSVDRERRVAATKAKTQDAAKAEKTEAAENIEARDDDK